METGLKGKTVLLSGASGGIGSEIARSFDREGCKQVLTYLHDERGRVEIEDLKKTLKEFDLTLAELVKVDVWLKNVGNVRVYEKLFRDYFEKDKYPARMGATTEFVDDDCLFMISGVAYRKDKES